MKNKIIIGAVFVFALCLTLKFVVFAPCKDDVCIQKQIDSMRTEKDAYQGRINSLNLKINDLKKGFSAGYVIQQIQTQHTQNVHPDILTMRNVSVGFIPKAMASSGDTMVSDVSLSTEQTGLRMAKQISVGRYGEVLAEMGSPYSSVPIEKYCNQAELTQYQCDILVGITFQESNVGKAFAKRSNGVIVPANDQGTSHYNPAGLKGGWLSYPTADGWYVRPFKSWDDFWSFYPAHMKRVYFDRGAQTPEKISECYVKGDCKVEKPSWVAGVKFFMSKLK